MWAFVRGGEGEDDRWERRLERTAADKVENEKGRHRVGNFPSEGREGAAVSGVRAGGLPAPGPSGTPTQVARVFHTLPGPRHDAQPFLSPLQRQQPTLSVPAHTTQLFPYLPYTQHHTSLP